MRFSTVQFQQQSVDNILEQQVRLNKVQQQVSTGKKINTPSDDPVQSSTLLLLKQRLAQVDSFKANSDVAENKLSLEESVLQSMTNSLQRVQELQVRAGNTILGKEDRSAIIQEMKTLRDEMAGFANTKDENSEYLFSGFQNNAQPFTQDASGNFIYNGDAGQRFLSIESGLAIPISDSGFDTFVNVPNGNGIFQISDPTPANTGDGIISPGSVINQSAYVPDTYTITFVTNSSGQLGYQVVGATTGQIVPALPAAIPANAPAYVSGQSITFNGIEVTVTGTPAIGDNFQLKPSTKQNLLNTMNSMIAALNLPVGNTVERAAATNQLSQSFASLEQGINNLLNVRAQIGTRLNAIDNAKEVNSNFQLHTQTVISSIEDVDYTQAISDLQFQKTVLEAAQQTFLTVQRLSLFDKLSGG